MTKHALLAMLFTAASSFAADDAESKKLLQNLQGAYKIVAAERSGGAPAGGFLEEIERVSIKGDKFAIVFKEDGGKKEEKSATIAVDASKKPAQIDMKPEDAKKAVVGIIALDGDTLKICWDDAREADVSKRPTEFKTSKDDKFMLFTLKRVKE